jgi:hypothetical protein
MNPRNFFAELKRRNVYKVPSLREHVSGRARPRISTFYFAWPVLTSPAEPESKAS